MILDAKSDFYLCWLTSVDTEKVNINTEKRQIILPNYIFHTFRYNLMQQFSNKNIQTNQNEHISFYYDDQH